MDKYISVNLLKIKDGRPYFLNVPQMRQSYDEVLEILEEFKGEVLEMQKLGNERNKEEQAVDKKENPVAKEATPELKE